MKVSVAFRKGDRVISCYLELRGDIGPFVPLGWLDDEDFAYHADKQDVFRELYDYWREFHDITEGAFDDLIDRTVYIPSHKIEWIRTAE